MIKWPCKPLFYARNTKSLRSELFKQIDVQYFSTCIVINTKIVLFHIQAQAASVLFGGINIGERLIGGKPVLINLAEKQSQIMWNLKSETVKPADTVVLTGSHY